MIPVRNVVSKRMCRQTLLYRIITPYAGIIQIRLEGSGPADPISAVLQNSTPDVQLLRFVPIPGTDIVYHRFPALSSRKSDFAAGKCAVFRFSRIYYSKGAKVRRMVSHSRLAKVIFPSTSSWISSEASSVLRISSRRSVTAAVLCIHTAFSRCRYSER